MIFNSNFWSNCEELMRGFSLQDINIRDFNLQYISLQDINNKDFNLQDISLQAINHKDFNLQDIKIQDTNLQAISLQVINLKPINLKLINLLLVNLLFRQNTVYIATALDVKEQSSASFVKVTKAMVMKHSKRL